MANRPDAMTFVLIDYKGGSAFKDCARLPHTVGMVSDLDGHLTERALASLSAELKRREEILLHAGAKDIEDYWDTRRLSAGAGPAAPAGADHRRVRLAGRRAARLRRPGWSASPSAAGRSACT